LEHCHVRSVISVTVCAPSCSRNSCALQGGLGKRVILLSTEGDREFPQGINRNAFTGNRHLFPRVLVAYVRHQSGRTPNPAAARRPHNSPVNGRSGGPTGTTPVPVSGTG